MFKEVMLRAPLAISLGAIAGALSRYYLTVWMAQRFGTTFPYGTFLINLTGCLGMGFFTTYAIERITTIPQEVQLLISTGFLGAYTTFSAYGLESIALLNRAVATTFSLPSFVLALLYWLGSALLGLLSVLLGIRIAQWFSG